MTQVQGGKELDQSYTIKWQYILIQICLIQKVMLFFITMNHQKVIFTKHLFPMKHLSYIFKMLVILTAGITLKSLVPFLKLGAQHLCCLYYKGFITFLCGYFSGQETQCLPLLSPNPLRKTFDD